MSARNAPCGLLRKMQLISRYAIRSAAYRRATAPHKHPGGWSWGAVAATDERSVGGQPQQAVLHLVVVHPGADPERVERCDVGPGLGVPVGEQVGQLLGPAVARVEVQVERAG